MDIVDSARGLEEHSEMGRKRTTSTKAGWKDRKAKQQALRDKDKDERQRNGSTPELAIVEDQWVWRRRNCPDATVLLQKLIGRNGKYFDELTLMSADEVRVVYFDVSDLHEKEIRRLTSLLKNRKHVGRR